MKRILAYISLIALLLTALAGSAAAESGIGNRIAYLTVGESVSVAKKIGKAPASELTWSVTDSAVIAAEGATITARSEGTAIATAAYNGKTLSFGIVALPESIEVKVGETYQLPYGRRESFAVRNKKIARVNGKGVVYGVAAGSTVVRVKYKKQVKYVNVNVVEERTENNAGSSEQSRAAELDCAATADQIVLVEYTGGSSAVVSIHEKQNGIWTEIGSCNGYVGANGIGKTKEGDKKTPEGTYNLTTPFGIKDDPGAKLAYTKVTKYHYWCGRSSSQYYNQLVDTRVTGTSVTSSDEYLINYKGVYNYCMFIDYNAAGVAHKGSCIFLHCKGSRKYTAGCVAVDESFMVKIIKWADAGCKIVIKNK